MLNMINLARQKLLPYSSNWRERGEKIASSLYFVKSKMHAHTIKNGKLRLGSSKDLRIFIFSITNMIQTELVRANCKSHYFTF